MPIIFLARNLQYQKVFTTKKQISLHFKKQKGKNHVAS